MTNNLTTLRAAPDIAERVRALGAEISRDYAGRTIDLVYMINGASTFAQDLARQITVPVRMHAVGFTSYPKPSPSGEVRLTLDVTESLHGRDLLLVEGIIVSGRTPKYIAEMFRLRQPASLALCAIGVKRPALAVDLEVAYSAFEFTNEVVVGYGVGDGPEKTLPYLAARAQ
jgi:hypoxanthine phosphoribosyltransferase